MAEPLGLAPADLARPLLGAARLAFPAPPRAFPTKDEVADYLEAYAARFDLPVRTGINVDRVRRNGSGYLLSSGDLRLEADNVVVASGGYQRPRVPDFASELDRGIVQLDSTQYRNPSQLQEGGVLVVGAGNSGAEIAFEVSRLHPTWLSGRDVGQTPVRHGGVGPAVHASVLVRRLARADDANVPGTEGSPKDAWQRAPLEPVRRKDLAAAGIERVPRTTGVQDGLPVLEDGRVLEVANVIWCTGFTADFGWIDLPAFDSDREPAHDRGVVADAPGLYLVGRFFLFALTSSLIGGVGRDAEHIAEHIAKRSQMKS